MSVGLLKHLKSRLESERHPRVPWPRLTFDILGDFVLSSSKTPITFIAYLGNIPQDHDSIFTVASMFKQMQDLPLSFPSWPGIYTGNDTQSTCICLNIEAPVKIES